METINLFGLHIFLTTLGSWLYEGTPSAESFNQMRLTLGIILTHLRSAFVCLYELCLANALFWCLAGVISDLYGFNLNILGNGLFFKCDTCSQSYSIVLPTLFLTLYVRKIGVRKYNYATEMCN